MSTLQSKPTRGFADLTRVLRHCYEGLMTRSGKPVVRRIRDRRQQWGRRRSDIVGNRDRPRILVIEPHEDTRLLYTRFFEASGYEVEATADGLTGIAHARMRFPDVVVMEMIVPQADGCEILAQIREDPATRTIPCVIVTSHLHVQTPDRASGTGATVILAKPVPLQRLLAEADALLIATPRHRLIERYLRRLLATLQELVPRFQIGDTAQESIRTLIDRLQIAVLAINETGHYVAASEGAEMLTGYAREELLRMSVADNGWSLAVPTQDCPGLQLPADAFTTTIRSREGKELNLCTTVVTLSPGLHAAACALLD
jgi:CheY-like chemotaxis protein